MMGEASPLILAPAIKYCWLWDAGQYVRHTTKDRAVMENADIAPALEKHAGIKASVGWAVSCKCDRFMPRSEAAFWHYQLGRIDSALRDMFWEGLVDGLGLTKQSPVYHLREKLLEMRSSSSLEGVRGQRAVRGALVVKAWNMAQRSERCTALTWNPKIEAFPEIAARRKGAA
jgi:hypothetical protein